MSPNDTQVLDESCRVFLDRIHKGIFVVGLELGFLLQGSTVPIQDVALAYVPDTSSQLFLSLIWGYILATTGLLLFFACQRLVKALLHLEVEDDDHEHQHQHHHHHHLIDLQCCFAQGSVLGVFLSWLLVDGLLNFRTKVFYGGIVFLVSLLFVIQGCWDPPVEGDQESAGKESSSQRHWHALVHVL